MMFISCFQTVVASEAVDLTLEGGSVSLPEQEVSVLKDAISKLDMDVEKLKKIVTRLLFFLIISKFLKISRMD